MAIFCENGNEPSGSIKGVEILGKLSDYRLLMLLVNDDSFGLGEILYQDVRVMKMKNFS
jgi:hypothetical protein